MTLLQSKPQWLVFIFLIILKCFTIHTNIIYKYNKKVVYPSGAIVNFGNELTPTQVKDKPIVTWDVESDSYYTLIMSDPDAPSRETPTFREISHWYVVNIPGNNVEKGDTIVDFIGSGPPEGTGLHRYAFLIFKQNGGKLEYDETFISNR